jgi:hypothetical protein
MSRKSRTVVPAAFIRAAFASGEFTARDESLPALVGNPGSKTGTVRGRLSPSAIEDFEAQFPGHAYAGEKSAIEGRQVTLALTKPNARGARLKRPEAFPVSQVRALAGAKDTGRLSEAAKVKAAEAVMRERGWL